MKTKACKLCQSAISAKAKRCPECGGRLSTHPLTGCFAIVVLILVGMVVATVAAL